jgi:hypothetical protein
MFRPIIKISRDLTDIKAAIQAEIDLVSEIAKTSERTGLVDKDKDGNDKAIGAVYGKRLRRIKRYLNESESEPFNLAKINNELSLAYQEKEIVQNRLLAVTSSERTSAEVKVIAQEFVRKLNETAPALDQFRVLLQEAIKKASEAKEAAESPVTIIKETIERVGEILRPKKTKVSAASKQRAAMKLSKDSLKKALEDYRGESAQLRTGQVQMLKAMSKILECWDDKTADISDIKACCKMLVVLAESVQELKVAKSQKYAMLEATKMQLAALEIKASEKMPYEELDCEGFIFEAEFGEAAVKGILRKKRIHEDSELFDMDFDDPGSLMGRSYLISAKQEALEKYQARLYDDVNAILICDEEERLHYTVAYMGNRTALGYLAVDINSEEVRFHEIYKEAFAGAEESIRRLEMEPTEAYLALSNVCSAAAEATGGGAASGAHVRESVVSGVAQAPLAASVPGESRGAAALAVTFLPPRPDEPAAAEGSRESDSALHR